MKAEKQLARGRQNFLNLLKNREVQLSKLDEKWTIIGEGSIGDKAEELRRKAWAIEKAGFVTNPRVVLAMGFFKKFMRRNGIYDVLAKKEYGKVIERIYDGEFSRKEIGIILNIAKQFEGIPLAVRSSAHGDSRGTGIYDSEVYFNKDEKADELIKKIKSVLVSEFTWNAIHFREDTGLNGGMAVIIEPVLGQRFLGGRGEKAKELCYGPVYGGIAYTSTSSGKGILSFAPGLPTVAVKGLAMTAREGDKRTISEIASNSSFYFYENDARAAYNKNYVIIDIATKGEWLILDTEVLSKMYVNIKNEIKNSSTEWIFEKLKKLENLLGKPQYVEWAIIETDKKSEIAILQMSDINLKTDFYEFADNEKTLVKSNFVSGSGIKICKNIVRVMSRGSIELLSEYNDGHEDYMVIYAGEMISTIPSYHDPLEYQHLRNSSVVVELYNAQHDEHPIAHFEGALSSTGKLFMVVTDVEWLNRLGAYKKSIERSGARIEVYNVNVKVTMSERQQKGIVELIED